jgi:hypothetical protein
MSTNCEYVIVLSTFLREIPVLELDKLYVYSFVAKWRNLKISPIYVSYMRVSSKAGKMTGVMRYIGS